MPDTYPVIDRRQTPHRYLPDSRNGGSMDAAEKYFVAHYAARKPVERLFAVSGRLPSCSRVGRPRCANHTGADEGSNGGGVRRVANQGRHSRNVIWDN